MLKPTLAPLPAPVTPGQAAVSEAAHSAVRFAYGTHDAEPGRFPQLSRIS